METVKQEQATERTFTQAELNQIVSDRLTREQAKYADYADLKAKAAKLDEIEEANKTELQKANERAEALQGELDGLKKAEALRQMRATVANETGVPAKLLTAETKEACAAQAQAIMEFAKPATYPNVKDGGETAVTTNKTNRQMFADWLNAQS